MPDLCQRYVGISIHALLAESDPVNAFHDDLLTNFYPRSPCGERPERPRAGYYGRAISIHALLAESDSDAFAAVSTLLISIHALLAESDRFAISAHCFDGRISIHALLAESDYILPL